MLIDLYFGWTSTCPHCAMARPFIEELARLARGSEREARKLKLLSGLLMLGLGSMLLLAPDLLADFGATLALFAAAVGLTAAAALVERARGARLPGPAPARAPTPEHTPAGAHGRRRRRQRGPHAPRAAR